MEKDNLKFIARHYKPGMFSASKGWRRLGIAAASPWRRVRTAAAVAAAICLTASAAYLYHDWRSSQRPATETSATADNTPPTLVVRAIDFENAPLPKVVERIREVYGVEVTGLPENPEEYVLSLHYEGNVNTLLESINEILDTKLKVKKQ